MRRDSPVNTKHVYDFIQCCANVEDVGPTLYKCYTNVLCLLGLFLLLNEKEGMHLISRTAELYMFSWTNIYSRNRALIAIIHNYSSNQ